MAKRVHVAIVVMAVFNVLCLSAQAQQTIADESLMLDAQIDLVAKRKKLQDSIGVDPILSRVPRVVSVISFGEQSKAKLMLPNGVALTYGEGDVINSQMRVVAITPREVVVAVQPSSATGATGKGKKAKEPVLMPLEFMAGAQQIQVGSVAAGVPGTPGTPVGAFPIPPALLQNPPAMAGGSLGAWPQISGGSSGQQTAAGSSRAAAAQPASK
ncbi:hypothetical protein [Paracidovorax wautersii]|uniref:hypothetical protein n=1 Tax=Paracidovorax wautersii TaxID=1177982 RepID=UPI000B853C3E|nr:hypothetical protein [Paracidovorax wautersii]